MDRRRAAWLVAVPMLAAASAMVLGAAAAAATAVVVAPFDGAEPTFAVEGRALLGVTLGDLDDPLRALPVLTGVLLGALTWSVAVGLGAQRLFPARRRLLPAAAAVVLAGLVGWITIGGMAAGAVARDITVGSAAGALVLASVGAGVAVLLPAGFRWPMPSQPVPPRRRPAATARPAGLR